jgi:hypothetical protein
MKGFLRDQASLLRKQEEFPQPPPTHVGGSRNTVSFIETKASLLRKQVEFHETPPPAASLLCEQEESSGSARIRGRLAKYGLIQRVQASLLREQGEFPQTPPPAASPLREQEEFRKTPPTHVGGSPHRRARALRATAFTIHDSRHPRSTPPHVGGSPHRRGRALRATAFTIHDSRHPRSTTHASPPATRHSPRATRFYPS